jgi:uncharacterized protein
MGTRTEHAPGTFSWVDLTTKDGDAAKAFYSGLFGWEFDDSPIPEEFGGGVYSMCKVGGENVAAISPTTQDVRPHWNSYVTVASADDAAAKVKELGGTVVEEPFDVMEAGRMAPLQDPTGAMLAVWEPRGTIGAGRVNEPGCLTWNELHTPDPDTALEFYSGLFGWGSEHMEMEGGPGYTVIKLGERSNGGMLPTQQGEPPHWLPYFVVESREDAAEKVKSGGGREWIKMDMPQGKIAVFSDSEDVPFAVWEGEVQD